ncbi:MAG: hypothetical protein J7J38_02700 [Candidatus Aenigmarchaeota archaeon]|nr:hypothetical protein [Candidatus Aenigmarchaeota archaeon]
MVKKMRYDIKKPEELNLLRKIPKSMKKAKESISTAKSGLGKLKII